MTRGKLVKELKIMKGYTADLYTNIFRILREVELFLKKYR